MTILYIIIVLLVIIIFIFGFIIYSLSKKFLSSFDKDLIIFVIDMYLSYGESIDIFPNDDSKKMLINQIEKLKIEIERDVNSGKKNKKQSLFILKNKD